MTLQICSLFLTISSLLLTCIPGSLQQCMSSCKSAVGSYCYRVYALNPDYQSASIQCALENSSLPTFKTLIEYEAFINFWEASNFGNKTFFINLYNYGSNTWTWMDDGSALTFSNSTVLALSLWQFSYSCACANFEASNYYWFNCPCVVQQLQTRLVCQQMRTDIPQPCFPLIRTEVTVDNHRFTTDSSYSKQNSYHSEVTYLAYLGVLPYYISEFTAAIYELYEPTSTVNTVLAYGNETMINLMTLGYILRRVAFYLPLFPLTGQEITFYQLSLKNPPIDSLLAMAPEKNGLIPYGNWLLNNTLLAFTNTAACYNMSIDCNYTEWTNWSDCSMSCGSGSQFRTRTYLTPAVGRNCSYNATLETQTCILVDCPIFSKTCQLNINHFLHIFINVTAGITMETLLNITGINEALADPASLTATIEDSIPYILASQSEAMQKSLGFQIEDNVKVCTFDHTFCQMNRDFITAYQPSLGNCFTFNYPNTPFYSVYRAGEIYGLTLLLYSYQDDYICSTTKAGFRVYIHDPSVYPFIDNMGYLLTPGIINSFYLRQLNVALLESPYGRCITSEAQKNKEYYYPKNYSVEGCYRSCYQKNIISTCGCGDPRFPIPQTAKKCGIMEKPCIDRMAKCESDFDRSICQCEQPCRDTTYFSTITNAHIYNSPFILQYCGKTGSNFSDCLKMARKDYAILQISFQALSIFTYEEQPAYDINGLWADFSGVVGLLLGIAVMTLPEIVIFFCDCCFTVCCAKRKIMRA